MKKNILSLMLALIVSICLVPSAFAAETDSTVYLRIPKVRDRYVTYAEYMDDESAVPGTTEEVTPVLYAATKDGFSIYESETPVPTITTYLFKNCTGLETTYYSINDIAALTGESDPATWIDGEDPTAICFTDHTTLNIPMTNGYTAHLYANFHKYYKFCSMTGSSPVWFGWQNRIKINGEHFLPMEQILTMFSAGIIDGRLSILTPSDSYHPLVNASTTLSETEQIRLNHAIWMAFVASPDDYEALDFAEDVKLLTPHEVCSMTGEDEAAAAFVKGNENTIYINSNSWNHSTCTTLTSMLVHEATHLAQFTKGDYSEKAPCEAQIRTLILLDEDWSTVTDTIKAFNESEAHKEAYASARAVYDKYYPSFAFPED